MNQYPIILIPTPILQALEAVPIVWKFTEPKPLAPTNKPQPINLTDLNGKNKTLVTLGAHDETYMTIGGGESEQYVVNVTFNNISFTNLVDLSKPEKIEKLVVGGQEGNYHAKLCVDLQTALLAAKKFAELGQLEQSVSWEEDKPLVVL